MATAALVAFTTLSVGAQIVKGVQENAAYREQGDAMVKQARIAKEEAEYTARQKQLQVDKAAAKQAMAFAANGIRVSSGSPLEILHETISLGEDEVNAIVRQGNAQIDYYTSTANNLYNSGRSAVLGGISGAASSIGSSVIFGASNGLFGANKGTATGLTPSIF